MPLYEYECPSCGRFEVIQKFSDKTLKHCPTCKEKGKTTEVTKAVSASAFHLKGGGWYKDGYSGTSTSSTAPKESSSTASASADSGASSAPKKACGSGCGCH